MLAVSTASDAIVSSVLKFVENLLDLDVELGNEDNPLRSLLLPHVDVLVCSLQRLFVQDGATKRQMLDKELKSEQESSGTWVRHILSNFLLKHMGTAMNKEDTIQKVWMDLLRDKVLRLPTVEDFKSFAVLYSEDPVQDFFNNIVHLQRHRRARPLLRFKNAISSGNLSKVLINKVFIPLFFKMLLDGQAGKGENIRSAFWKLLDQFLNSWSGECIMHYSIDASER